MSTEQKMALIISSPNPDGGKESVFFAGVAPIGEDLYRAADWARDKFQRDSMHVAVCLLSEVDHEKYQVDWSSVKEYRSGNDLWDHVAARTRIWADSY